MQVGCKYRATNKDGKSYKWKSVKGIPFEIHLKRWVVVYKVERVGNDIPER